MTDDMTAARPLSLKDAFETEYARRETERRAKEEAVRRQQEVDLAAASEILAALQADPEFLQSRGLVAEQRRYSVLLDHDRFRISAYFENGTVSVTQADKRAVPAGASAPRRQETVHSLPDALRLIAQFLVDETADPC
jgi:hypothetical protein